MYDNNLTEKREKSKLVRKINTGLYQKTITTVEAQKKHAMLIWENTLFVLFTAYKSRAVVCREWYICSRGKIQGIKAYIYSK